MVPKVTVLPPSGRWTSRSVDKGGGYPKTGTTTTGSKYTKTLPETGGKTVFGIKKNACSAREIQMTRERKGRRWFLERIGPSLPYFLLALLALPHPFRFLFKSSGGGGCHCWTHLPPWALRTDAKRKRDPDSYVRSKTEIVKLYFSTKLFSLVSVYNFNLQT